MKEEFARVPSNAVASQHPHAQSPDATVPAPAPAYLDFQSEQLYCVQHGAAGGKGRACVLLLAPFATQRERGYSALVRWARVLAGHGMDVVRFDPRGVGESTGDFERFTFADWVEDARFMAAYCKDRFRDRPLVLGGVVFGALLASRVFAGGQGDALLACSAPEDGRAMLWDYLRRTLMAEMMANPHAPRTTREQIAAQIGAGERVNVDGYFWTKALWERAPGCAFAAPALDDARPWRVIDFRGMPATPIVGDGGAASRRETTNAERFWESSPRLVPPNCEGFFEATARWMLDAASVRGTLREVR
jgi:pimeloyl-ACP methyl ester carboxylesterase